VKRRDAANRPVLVLGTVGGGTTTKIGTMPRMSIAPSAAGDPHGASMRQTYASLTLRRT
jgi:hypothetical protein